LVNLTELDDSPPRLLKLFPEMPLVRKVMSLATWVMLAMMTQYFVNAADNLMVGRLPAEQATASQAALGLGMPLYWAVGGFFSAVGYGAQAMTARRYAEGETKRAGQVLYNAVMVAILCGILGSAIGWFSAELTVSYLAQASEEQKELGIRYVQWRALGIAAMVVTFAYKAFFDGIGRTQVHLVAAVIMNVTNIGLNYLLIYGNPALGIPVMGLDGAGIASMLATYIGLFYMIGASMTGRYRLFEIYKLGNRDGTVIRNVLRLMLPSGSASLILMAGFLLFFKFVGQIDAAEGTGNTYSAATKALMDTGALCFMPLLAFGTATATAVSQSLGAGKPNLAARYGWESVRVGIWAVLPVGVVFFIWPEQIIALWSPNDPAVPAAAASSLRMIATCLPAMVIGMVCAQALYGAGANTYVMIAEGLLHFGVLVPLAWLLGPFLGLGLIGIWASAVIYVFGLALAMGGKFLGKGWRKIEL
jgi:MATE family multidrug resistance protein